MSYDSRYKRYGLNYQEVRKKVVESLPKHPKVDDANWRAATVGDDIKEWMSSNGQDGFSSDDDFVNVTSDCFRRIIKIFSVFEDLGMSAVVPLGPYSERMDALTVLYFR